MRIDRLGHGAPLVLIHGWAMHGGIWGGVLERLATRYAVYAVDLPGHGASRDDENQLEPVQLAARIALETPPEALWMGWSLGGMIALRAALDHPRHVAALIPVAATPRFTRADHWPHGVDESVISRFEADLRRDFDATLRRFLALEVHGCDTQRADLRILRRTAFEQGAPAPRVLAEGLHILHHLDLLEEAERIHRPTCFIVGQRDRLVPWSGCVAAAERMPSARCEVIPGAGHAPFIGHPDEFLRLVFEFADSL